MSLGGYLAALRSLHGENYGQSSRDGKVTVFGAYGMLLENWGEWSQAAGFPGADPRDPDAQDAVAAHWANQFFNRYGDWDLVSAAWYAGQDQADAMLQQGRTLFRDDRVRRWQEAVGKTRETMADAPIPTSASPRIAQGAWINPVAGHTNYSDSFRPNTLSHRGRTHPAVDVYAAAGTPVVSPSAGVVVGVGTGEVGGNWVRIKDKQGLEYYFAHMQDAAKVKVGQAVGAGEHVGFVGNTGSASTTSPHLHLSIKRGAAYINPYSFLQGSTNANGAFEAMADAAPTIEENPIGTTLDRMLETVSNTMAGEERLDPREIGIRPKEQQPE